MIRKVCCLVLLSLLPALHCAAKKTEDPTLNIVLDHMIVGKQSLDAGDYTEAKVHFDSVLNNIEAVWGDDEAAMQARSLWYEEGSKGFKGEPYERVMAYLYRGLLYIQDDDLENARACFRLAYLQDSFEEEEQRDCDFAVIYLLLAWCDHQLGETERAQQTLSALAMFRPDLADVDLSSETIVFVESGVAPRKLRDGVSQNRLVYRRGKKIKEEFVAYTDVTEQSQSVVLMDNLYFQSSSRGGRPIDGIIDGKVVFKNKIGGSSDAVGQVASVGMVFSSLDSSGEFAAISGGLAVLGFVGHSITNKVNAKADVRAWDNLPDSLHVMLMDREMRDSIQSFKFLDKNRAVIREQQYTQQKGNVIWIR